MLSGEERKREEESLLTFAMRVGATECAKPNSLSIDQHHLFTRLPLDRRVIGTFFIWTMQPICARDPVGENAIMPMLKRTVQGSNIMPTAAHPPITGLPRNAVLAAQLE